MLRLLHGLNRALVVCAVLLLAGTICFAQESRGSITGKVLDPAGAVIPGAKVTVTDVGTNVSSALTSNSTGYWEVNFLTPGEYSVTVEAAGFKTLKQTGITLDTGDRLALDMKLEIGESTRFRHGERRRPAAEQHHRLHRPRAQHAGYGGPAVRPDESRWSCRPWPPA